MSNPKEGKSNKHKKKLKKNSIDLKKIELEKRMKKESNYKYSTDLKKSNWGKA